MGGELGGGGRDGGGGVKNESPFWLLEGCSTVQRAVKSFNSAVCSRILNVEFAKGIGNQTC